MVERTPEVKRARRLGMLRRRAAHLQQRIESNPEKKLSYDEAERAALLWAIDVLRQLFPDLAEPKEPKR